MKYSRDENGKIRNCTNNVSKMRWYEYGWHFGRRRIVQWYKEYFSEISRIFKVSITLIIATILIPFTPLIYPFAWSNSIRKAKKEVKEWEKKN